jgi:GTPase Era involved in 16S rRNA processing
MEVPLSQIFRLEAALPAESLDIVQIVDFPGTSDPIHQVDLTTLGQHKIDALLWATIATQAWRESERRAWLSLPQKLRSRGILVVTHMDLIQTAQDQERLKQRLQAVAQDYFKGVCFISAGKALKAGNIEMASGLFVELNKLAASFEMERLQKAVELSRKLGSYGLLRLAQDTVPQ